MGMGDISKQRNGQGSCGNSPPFLVLEYQSPQLFNSLHIGGEYLQSVKLMGYNFQIVGEKKRRSERNAMRSMECEWHADSAEPGLHGGSLAVDVAAQACAGRAGMQKTLFVRSFNVSPYIISCDAAVFLPVSTIQCPWFLSYRESG